MMDQETPEKKGETSEEKQKTPEENFKPDYRIAKLAALGILGFIVGCIFLFYPDFVTFGKEDSVFHEIIYVPKDIVSKPIAEIIPSLENKNKERSTEKKKNENVLKVTISESVKDSLTKRNSDLDEEIAIEKSNISRFKTFQSSYSYTSLSDTSSFIILNKALHFTIEPDTIKKWDHDFMNWNYDSIKRAPVFVTNYSFKDPSISFPLLGSTTLQIKKYSTDIDFITKYPSTGIWLLLILTFCSFLFITISTCIYLKNKIVALFKENDIEGLSIYDYYWVSTFTFITLLILAFIWKKSFYDEEIIKNLFFMKSLDVSMQYIVIIGYFAGAFCLAGFIHTAAMLGYFAKNIKSKTKEIAKQHEDLIKHVDEISKENQASGQDLSHQQAENISTNQNALIGQQEKHSKNKQIFESLVGFFNTYFLLSAIILSLMVLCTGGLYSTVNSLDFVKLLADDWGYSPARADFVYLYGGLHTIVLLLVYIPAKMRFSEISIGEDETAIMKTQTADGKWYDFLKDPFGKLKDVLIAASPLLASLIQSLFGLIFK